jgi:hypothetical protein
MPTPSIIDDYIPPQDYRYSTYRVVVEHPTQKVRVRYLYALNANVAAQAMLDDIIRHWDHGNEYRVSSVSEHVYPHYTHNPDNADLRLYLASLPV